MQHKNTYNRIEILPIVVEKTSHICKRVEINLLLSNQSGFGPKDTKSLKVLTVMKTLKNDLFLDMSKHFDKAAHEGIRFKLKQNVTE